MLSIVSLWLLLLFLHFLLFCACLAFRCFSLPPCDFSCFSCFSYFLLRLFCTSWLFSCFSLLSCFLSSCGVLFPSFSFNMFYITVFAFYGFVAVDICYIVAVFLLFWLPILLFHLRDNPSASYEQSSFILAPLSIMIMMYLSHAGLPGGRKFCLLPCGPDG